MEIFIRNSQRRIKINPQRLERFLRRAVKRLALSDGETARTGAGNLRGKRPVSRTDSVSPSLLSSEISVLLVNDSRMRSLNRLYHGKDKVTDVLSFPQLSGDAGPHKGRGPAASPSIPLGDIVINLPQAQRQAGELGTTLYSEIERLLVHGLLHLLGYDHEKNKYQAARMKAREAELREALCL